MQKQYKMSGCNSHSQPPLLSPDGADYNLWKQDIDLWCSVTKTAVSHRAPQIYLSLVGKGRQGAMKIPHDQLKTNDGVKILLQHLDKVFLPNKPMRLFNANNKLRNVTRKPGGLVKDYLLEFDNAKFLLEQEGLKRDDTLLGLDLLAQCQLSESKNQLVMTGLSDVTYEDMKAKLSSIFFNEGDDFKKFDDSDKRAASSMENSEGTFYTNSYYQRSRGRGGSSRGRSSGNNWKRPRYERDTNNSRDRYDNDKKQSFRRENPPGQDGKPSKCNICQSIYHWARLCPNSYENNQNNQNDYAAKANQVNFNWFVAMFAEDDRRDSGKLQALLDETRGCAIIDSGCAKTVCGRDWAEEFMSNLSDNDRVKVQEEESHESFTFGDGTSVRSLKRLSLPCWIQGLERGFITTEVVERNIPLLLSKTTMKKSNMVLDFKNDTIICGKTIIHLRNTASGHYALPLSL